MDESSDKTTVLSMTHCLTIGCKLNLYLDITGVRPDGYHELDSVFYPCPEPHDTLELELVGGEGGLTLSCSEPLLEGPGNLVSKAYEAFAAATGWRPGLQAHLVKRIPAGAGLGGGSADAAALLGWLNGEAGQRPARNAPARNALSDDALKGLAAGLGADVPFFLLNRPARAMGIGDVLAPWDVDLSGLTVVVAVPEERVNTAWAYARWDEAAGRRKGSLGGAGAAREDDGAAGRRKGNVPGGVGASLSLTSLRPPGMASFCVSGALVANCFEAVVFEAYPAVRLLKERLLVLGASAAGMSGSGSAVFGIFRHSAQADAALSALASSGTAVFSALL